MNIVRDGIILIIYSFSIILAFIFLSSPLATMVSSIGAASDAPTMPYMMNYVNMVFSICCAAAILIPTIIFIWLAFNSQQEEYLY